MIHRVSANRSSFRSVEFGKGLNVVLADRADASTEKETRNGLGKSTLIDIIHFCLGARVRNGHGLAIEPLAGWEFSLEFSVRGQRITATRAVDNPRKISVEGLGSIGEAATGLVDDRAYGLEAWHQVLGKLLFGFGRDDEAKYQPTYRSLMSYFARRGGFAYLNPFQCHSKQQRWSQQVNLAYILGMNWRHASKWQALKEKEKIVRDLNKAIDADDVLSGRATVGELRARQVRLEDQLASETRSVRNFKVHPQYDAIRKEVDRITVDIHALTNENSVDDMALGRYLESVGEEEKPPSVPVARLYEDVGVVFTDAVKRTIEESREFRSQVIENRRRFLATEIERITRCVRERDHKIAKLTEERANRLRILETHGTMQEMALLQERIGTLRERLERVATAIDQRRELDTRTRDVGSQKTELAQVAQRDHDERRSSWSKAIRTFNDNSEALYEVPGQLIIDVGDNGFSYDVKIEKSGSDGVEKMKIFCFDLMLLQLQSGAANWGIDFLVHDSIIFDGVDSRQRARALERASAVAEGSGKQYICAFNSDMVPHNDFKDDFDFRRHVRLHLTDGDPAGSLLGFSFDR